MRPTFTVGLALCAFLAVTTARNVDYTFGKSHPGHHPACSNECIEGPGYWCQNITTSACCSATNYCIPHIWATMEVPEDSDSVCDICKNMVKQARDQLESNQTQEDLKEVFEGSCALIHIKPIVEECDKLVDQFIPDLVETLASQMNPSIVCSVAGLCNSPRIDKLLEEFKDQPQVKKTEGQISLANDEYSPDECSKCHTIVHHMEGKFKRASRDQVLNGFLNMCGELSSFSDACSSIILTYFTTIYDHLNGNFNTENICHITGQCSAKFHVHEDENKPLAVEVRPMSSVGVVEVGDDLPCKLCEQLVGHLRDLLVANTTESEFRQVLHGLCKQTKTFASECAAIVDEYYPEIYEFLTKNLNGNAVCMMAGICPAPGKKSGSMWPLIPQEQAEIALEINKDAEPKEDPSAIQLPLERYSIPGFPMVDDTYCSTCEFVIDHVKKNVKDTKNKDNIMMVLREVKSVLPRLQGRNGDINFLGKYEEALTELISEGKKFSEICSLVAVCPTNHQIEMWKKISDDFTIDLSIKSNKNCPLCELAITKIYDYIQDNRTEESIQTALDKLCVKLMPKNLKKECEDLVKIYSKELIQMLLKDMSAEEICEYLKFCDPHKVKKNHKSFISKKIVAVPENTFEGKQACAFCEYVLHFVQEAITNPKSQEEVSQVIKKICRKLPQSVENDCDEFVDTYSSALVAILAQEVDPSQVCPMIHVCPSAQLLEIFKKETKEVASSYDDKPNCPLCLFGVTQLFSVIKNNKTKESIESGLEKLCSHLPKDLVDQCDSFVKTYSEEIIDMIIADFTPEEVCVYLKLCDISEEVGPSISFFPLDKDGQIMTNEIPDYPVYQILPLQPSVKEPLVKDNTECVICQQIMAYVEKILGTHKSKEEIEQVLHEACDVLPKKLSTKCNNFVQEYGEIVIDLLTQDISPREICTIMELCKAESTTQRLKESVAKCALCESIVSTIEELVSDPNIKDLDEVLSQVCQHLPVDEQGKCTMMLEVYEQSIVNAILQYGPRHVCSKIGLCSSNHFLLMSLKTGRTRRQIDDKNLGTKPCTWGVYYWCVDNNTAEECKATLWCKKIGRLNKSTSTTIKAITERERDEQLTSEIEQEVSEVEQVVSETEQSVPQTEQSP